MIKMIALIASLVASGYVYAAPELTTLAEVNEFVAPKRMHRCVMRGWKRSGATADQSLQAEKFMNDAKAEMMSRKDAIHARVDEVKAAWMKYPIVRDEVAAAETALMAEVLPVKEAFRDAGINALNLLTQEQRTAFDTAFAACVNKRKK